MSSSTRQEADHQSAKTVLLAPSDGERWNIIGGGVRVLLTGENSGGMCCVFECPIPGGDGPPLHRHEREDELFYVISGRFKFSVDGKEFIGEAGAFACAPRGSVHAFKNVGSETGMLLVTCTPAGLEIPFRAIRDRGPGQPPVTMEEATAELARAGITFLGPPLA